MASDVKSCLCLLALLGTARSTIEKFVNKCSCHILANIRRAQHSMLFVQSLQTLPQHKPNLRLSNKTERNVNHSDITYRYVWIQLCVLIGCLNDYPFCENPMHLSLPQQCQDVEKMLPCNNLKETLGHGFLRWKRHVSSVILSSTFTCNSAYLS